MVNESLQEASLLLRTTDKRFYLSFIRFAEEWQTMETNPALNENGTINNWPKINFSGKEATLLGKNGKVRNVSFDEILPIGIEAEEGNFILSAPTSSDLDWNMQKIPGGRSRKKTLDRNSAGTSRFSSDDLPLRGSVGSTELCLEGNGITLLGSKGNNFTINVIKMFKIQ